MNQPNFVTQYQEMKNVIESVTDREIINRHISYTNPDGTDSQKSISTTTNALLKDRFVEAGWKDESALFQGRKYSGNN